MIKFSEGIIQNSPILAGLNSILSMLSTLDKENPITNKKENKIKLLTCDILEYFIFKRQDTVIDNVIRWFKHLIKGKHITNELIENEIKEEIKNIIPQIFATGIADIDNPPSENILANLKNIKNKIKNPLLGIGQSKLGKFEKIDEFKSLNNIFSENLKY